LLNAEEAKAILKDLGLANVLVKLIPTIPGYSRNEIALAVRRNTKYLGEFEGLRTEIGNQSPILVTSITGGDGKSSTAYNLALASSQTGRRTLIIELDLRSTSVATNISTATLGKEITEKGSSDTYYQENLADKIQPAQALMPNEIDVSNLFILPSMRVAQNLQQVLESDSVVDLFNQVSRDYDYIVVDAPSMSVDNAARSLLNNVKAFLLVVRPGNSPVDRFKEVVSFLSHYDNEKFVGVVVTAAGNIHKNLLK
jgi:Mrp family chromosome partitioning ATPase